MTRAQRHRQNAPASDATQPRRGSLPGAWQRLLERDHTHESVHGEHGALGFFLDLIDDGNGAAHLEVAPVTLSVLEHGRLGRAVPLDARRLAHLGLPAQEQRLAACMLGLPQSARKNRSYAHLAGSMGDALLAEMLDTAPCFLGGVAGLRLSRGHAMTLRWQWRQREDGSQQLSAQLPHGQRLLRIGALWYLDAERAEIGMLEHSREQAHLLDAPPLAPEHSAALASALEASALGDTLPPPQVFGALERADVAPRPVLTLHTLGRVTRNGHNGEGEARDTPARASRRVAYARLSFDYAGERLPGRGGEPLIRRLHEGKLVEIERRRAEELASMERLEGLGLTPAVDTEGLPWDMVDQLPDDAWMFPGKGYAGALEVNTPGRWIGLRERLETEQFSIEYASDFPFEVVEAPVSWYGDATAHEDSFDLEVGIEVDGQRVNLLPAVAQALGEQQLSLTPGAHEAEDAVWYAPLDQRRRVPLRLNQLRRMLAPLSEYLERPRQRQQLRLPRVQAGRLEELAQALPDDKKLRAPEQLRSFTRRLREAAEQASDTPPAGLNAQLRGYQREGLRWLNALAEAGVGGVLADDMGLGKTLQLLAHLATLQQSGQLEQAALVVAPTSLVPNWQAEAARFTPDLRVLVLQGPQRSEAFDDIATHDIVLTSYALLPRDIEVLRTHRFGVVVLDEAQQVKNPRTQARRALLALDAPRRLCVSGTPLENHLGELWSQLDLAVPGLLGDEAAFRRHYRGPIEKQQDADCQARLNRRIAPFILRRTKAEVASELPPKTEITRRVVMEGGQRELYESLRLSLTEELREVIAERGFEHSGIMVLDALLKLRQACCDPRLVKLESAQQVAESAKFELLMDMLPALVAEGRRMLVFSQFTEMLKLIADALKAQGLPYVMLTGDTRDRAEPVRRFQDGEVPVFLLSLKAGGVGLNLTAADTVIHYDPWWNPAAEAQASDRAHRIGQDKPVFVYRLITAGTVEERIEAMKARKAELADAVLEGGGSRDTLRFDQSDLDALLAPEPDAG
ncbi:DEAD/DEAH box helicase [Oleiagrimonas sp. C23AA]|uniref:DEAD/DEAH box helicase n=1 Tax=Oleiagrimonas sp. C23AA TaxID=2719047 RepID=UPI0014211E0A|nr:DEAD/DEAH box helicase [Oleiagrimonas sp. C23AA]NII10731.1 DEAD/DEAH box helicase [Oleiagrimonas sp. C23AA]